MKPSFALNFTDDSIGLLHRTSRGWLEVGSVPLDEPDLAQAVAYLRGSALGLEPRGITTKLVIPNNQILYMTLAAPGPDAASRRTQIKAELEGRTPYAVNDLVFDWWGKGPTVQVAVVARETLTEAEAFANENRLNPLSFVAIPEPGTFGAEPWFGASALAPTLLVAGEKVDRDQDPIQIVGRIPKAEALTEFVAYPVSEEEPTAAASETATEAEPVVVVVAPEESPVAAESATTLQETPVEAEPAHKADAALDAAAFDLPAEPNIPAAHEAPDAPETRVTPENPVDDLTRIVATDVTADRIVDDLPDALILAAAPRASDPPATVDDITAPAATTASPAPVTPVLRAPTTTPPLNTVLTDPRLTKKQPATQPPARSPARPPEPVKRPGPASGSPRLSAIPGGGGRGGKLTAPIPEAEWPLERVTSAARMAQGKGEAARNGSMITAPSIPMQRERKLSIVPAPLPESQGSPDTANARARERAEPIKAFGTQQSRQRGKPRYLGLILTLALLLLLAAVAALSSLFVAWNDDSATPAVASTETVAAPTAIAATDATTPPPTDTTPDATVGVTGPSVDPATAPEATADATNPIADPAAEPAPDDEMLADGQDPAALADQALAETAADPATDLTSEAPATTVASATPAPPAPEPAAPAVESATVAQPETSAASVPTPSDDPQDEIFLAMIDPAMATSDAIALAAPVTTTDAEPAAQPAPPPFGTLYQFDADGRIIPTKDGIITPEGVRLVAGPPPRVPPPRPTVAVAAPVAEPAAATPEPAYADPALAGARPRARPEGLVPASATTAADDTARLNVTDAPRFSSLRPRARPPEILARGEAALAAEESARDAATTAAVQAASASLVSTDQSNASPLAIAVSRKPEPRPQDINRAIEAAVSVAASDATLTIASPLVLPDTPVIESPVLRTPAPKAPVVEEPAAEPLTSFASAPASDDPGVVEQDEPERTSAAPKIPTRASVAKQATDRNAINLAKTNLIGVYGTSSNRYAMVRNPNGRFIKVEVGDRIDGGRVAAISDRELHYVKDGETHTLSMPKG